MFVGSQFLITKVSSQEGHILFHFLVVDTSTGEDHLRVGQDDLNLIPMSGYILLREVGKIDISLHCGLDGNGYLAFA